jgi:inner membrane transporter RhtA
LEHERGTRRGVVLPLAAALTAMACFQTGAATAKGLYPTVGPLRAATLRLTLGAVLLVAFFRPWRAWPRKAPLVPLVGLGVVTGGTVMLFYAAISRLPLGVAITLQFLGPLAVAVLTSHRRIDALWVVLAAGGVWSLVGVDAMRGVIDLWGVAFALAAAFGWGAYILLGRICGAAFGRATAALAASIAAIVVAPIGIAAVGTALFAPTTLPLALLVALLSTAMPFSLEMFALPRLPTRTFATFTSVEPAFGVSGALLLREPPSAPQLAGVALVIAAAAGAAWSGATDQPPIN